MKRCDRKNLIRHTGQPSAINKRLVPFGGFDTQKLKKHVQYNFLLIVYEIELEEKDK